MSRTGAEAATVSGSALAIGQEASEEPALGMPPGSPLHDNRPRSVPGNFELLGFFFLASTPRG